MVAGLCHVCVFATAAAAACSICLLSHRCLRALLQIVDAHPGLADHPAHHVGRDIHHGVGGAVAGDARRLEAGVGGLFVLRGANRERQRQRRQREEQQRTARGTGGEQEGRGGKGRGRSGK